MRCPNCNKIMKYNQEQKKCLCKACGVKIAVRPNEETCDCCGQEYLKYTWFDPSGCEKCYRSFVD